LPNRPSQASQSGHRAHRAQCRRRRKSNVEHPPPDALGSASHSYGGFRAIDGEAGFWADMNDEGKSADICNARRPSRKLSNAWNESPIPAHLVFPFPFTHKHPPMCLALPWTRYFLPRCHVIASTDGTWSRRWRHLVARSTRNPTSSIGVSTLPPAHSRFAIAFCSPTPFEIPGLWCARVRSGPIHHHLFHPPQLHIIVPWARVISSSTPVVLPRMEWIRPSPAQLVNADRDRSGPARRPATVHRLRIHRPSLSPGVFL
ncbi:hypothetical protein C8F01DRAFT_1167906, partial [Mycena amicta]